MKRTRDVVLFHTSKIGKMFLNGGFVVALDTVGEFCVNPEAGLAGRLLTASRKAERLKLVCLDRRQGNRQKGVFETGKNPIKISFFQFLL